MYTDENDNKNNEENNIYNYVKNEEPKKEKKSIKKMFNSLFKKEEKNEETIVDENFYNVEIEENNNSFIDNKNNMSHDNSNQEYSDNNNYEYNNDTYNTEYDYDNVLDNQQEPYVENHTTNYHKNFNFKNIGVIFAIILLVIGLIWFLISFLGNNNDNKINTNLTSLGLTVGKDYQLTVLTSIGSYAKYETTDNNIISLNNTTGYITALKEGQATVNILDKDNKVVETVTIYVVKNKIPVTNLEVIENITINKKEKKIIPLTLTPNNATEHNFNYIVADPSIINVTNGIIEGIKEGTTTINITNENISKTITVTVK